MPDSENDTNNGKITRYMNVVLMAVTLFILGSCVSEINSIGGGYDRNKKMAMVFFFHLFVFVCCVFVQIYAVYKLEKRLSFRQHEHQRFEPKPEPEPEQEPARSSEFGQRTEKHRQFGLGPEQPRTLFDLFKTLKRFNFKKKRK